MRSGNRAVAIERVVPVESMHVDIDEARRDVAVARVNDRGTRWINAP